jgi:hypothetical protein
MRGAAITIAERCRLSAAAPAGPGDNAHSERPPEMVEVIRCFISRDVGAPAPGASTAGR